MTLTSDKYKTLYAEVKREIRERAILYQVVASRQNSPLQSTAPNSRLRTITHLAVRCNHNATRRMRSKRRKMRCNHNPETRLRNNDRYAKAVVHTTEYKDISSLNYTQFIQTLKRETRIRISTEARWHSALQDTVATKLYRATFVIKPLI
ncbi:hypothetical protein HBH67_044950 [Parastagonospora nodorum]|nr:hypothetical protein HBH67_044950 [Parastagonospora nodorum]KAH4802014.1 hypothetical protein HBH63_062260 [Parastagonospora nodorum]